MGHPRRIEFAGALHHVTVRGAGQADIYRDPFDRERFLELLAETVVRCGWRCHAYCLMTNHYHLLVETPTPTLATGMQRLNARYSRSFNRRHERAGHLFEGRYRGILIERDAHLLEVARYVVLNPVRAGVCANAATWRWSSYLPTAGEAAVPAFLTVDWLLAAFAARRHVACRRYRAFVAEAPGRCPWRELRPGPMLGRAGPYTSSSSSAASGSPNGGIT